MRPRNNPGVGERCSGRAPNAGWLDWDEDTTREYNGGGLIDQHRCLSRDEGPFYLLRRDS
jgi:hypothetical protein